MSESNTFIEMTEHALQLETELAESNRVNLEKEIRLSMAERELAQWRAMAEILANKLRDIDDLSEHELEALAKFNQLKGQSK